MWNCVTSLFTPLEIQFSTRTKNQNHTPPSSEVLDLLQRWHLKDIDQKNHGYFYQGPYKRKVSEWLAFFKKMGGQSLLHVKFKLDLSDWVLLFLKNIKNAHKNNIHPTTFNLQPILKLQHNIALVQTLAYWDLNACP